MPADEHADTPNQKLAAIEIHLKSGQTFVAECNDLSVTHGRLEGDLRGIKWAAPKEAGRTLFHVEIDQIAAIVSIYG